MASPDDRPPRSSHRDNGGGSGEDGGPGRRRTKPIPERFRVGRATLLFDTFMNYFIKVGGIAVIGAICGIFVFLLVQILPLFQSAKVEFERTLDVGDLNVASVGIDPWSELAMFVEADGTLNFLDLADMESEVNRGFFTREPDLPGEHDFPYVRFNQREGRLVFGTDDGRFAVVEVAFEKTFPENREREIVPEITSNPLLELGDPDARYETIDYVDDGREKLAVAIQRGTDGRQRIHALTLQATQPLIGEPELTVGDSAELTGLFEGTPKFLRVTGDTDFVIIGTEEGEVHLLARSGSDFEKRQTVRPFAGYEAEEIHSMNFLYGDLSLIFTNKNGASVMHSVYHDTEAGHRILGLTKKFDPLTSGSGADFFSTSLRNKAFLLGGGKYATIRFATTEETRWEETLDFEIEHALLGGRYDKMAFLDPENRLHLFSVRDPHPQSSFKAFFGKIHYEGRKAPEFMWQSTGGGDDFEPKLSMVPLIWGTMKGTFFAMIIAAPIALLAAFYTSQFLKPKMRGMVKPVMEIMESVPTVVLGFLAALWMAPILSDSVPSVLLVIVAIPVSVLAFGALVGVLPLNVRRWIKPGYEFLYFAPVMFAIGYLAWSLGPVLEGLLFTVQDPNTGQIVADFRLWWSSAERFWVGEGGETTAFRQRNAFVVGIFMGFAIIPTIFTIAEDAMSNVPAAFRSGAFALGASRWQTAVTVVLPTAAAGIFSAIMIGFGRAVGETMILLMATGNTPIMTMNPFDGMRTLAANIAVELPEAAQGSTLYRALFLGAMLLFLMTFLVNTLAEILRQRLRDRYKAVE